MVWCCYHPSVAVIRLGVSITRQIDRMIIDRMINRLISVKIWPK